VNTPLAAPKRFLAILANAALSLLGIGIALAVLELLLRAHPEWIPPGVRVNPPVRHANALVDETYEWKLSDGDLFHWMERSIAPLSPAEDEVVARVHMITDVNGFRNFPPERAAYDIVALGDSFTRASGVATPWPQRLAEAAGMDVFNLGDVGVGPQAELAVLRQYGLPKQPKWVILAYFEGNDLYDAGSYAQANPFLVARVAKHLAAQALAAGRGGEPDGAQAAVENYRYPITLKLGQAEADMVFFSGYIAWLSVSREVIESSRNYDLAGETILQMRDLSAAAGADFLLVYVPTKEHVYLPFLKEAQAQESVYQDVPELGLDAGGFLQFTSQRAGPELVRQHMDAQEQVMADFATAHQVDFLDLTPAFAEAAAAGAQLYYSFDTHWNQLGHDLAAQAIAEYAGNLNWAAAP
jgi:hypothetical protein